jgi:hypothetical protein
MHSQNEEKYLFGYFGQSNVLNNDKMDRTGKNWEVDLSLSCPALELKICIRSAVQSEHLITKSEKLNKCHPLLTLKAAASEVGSMPAHNCSAG